eukprot:s1_g1004.t1
MPGPHYALSEAVLLVVAIWAAIRLLRSGLSFASVGVFLFGIAAAMGVWRFGTNAIDDWASLHRVLSLTGGVTGLALIIAQMLQMKFPGLASPSAVGSFALGSAVLGGVALLQPSTATPMFLGLLLTGTILTLMFPVASFKSRALSAAGFSLFLFNILVVRRSELLGPSFSYAPGGYISMIIQLPSAPDSDIAKSAALFLAEVSAPQMVHHCHRSFLFAELLGEQLGRRADKEVLYVGALFHDLGLDHAIEGEEEFEVRGGNAAEEFLLARGANTRLAASVKTAISLHTDLASADHNQPEVALLHMGAMVDVVGMRIDDVPAKTLDLILQEHPRTGCKAHLKELLNAEAARKPSSGIAAAIRDLNLNDLIQQAPFSE